ncbi:hypothetical protein H6794_02775 [Candidatus Nomurabacteria bacterium]|jgi:pimeloyl-ACP methyl ester carboxylesterase|nr:hypothetical protein [Candidatus Saccharibacteria bacterium]MCB9839755.1 hypothetical protein [Candidatus Nomurabacteria bacterium]
MKQNIIAVPGRYIAPLTINGLNGRMLKLPVTNQEYKNRNILLIYGHHSCIERMYSIAQNIADYGNVLMPDMPGFGGMDSFFIIKKKPTLDNYADYLATLIKLQYKRKKITIAGMSFGFLVVTKMLQKYPELASQVDMVISMVGFTTTRDFKLSTSKMTALRYGSLFFSTRPTAFTFRHLALNKLAIKFAYGSVSKIHPKMKDAESGQELAKRITFEAYLWQINDVRTYMKTTARMMNVDLTQSKTNLQVHHVTVDADQYFNNKKVKQNMRKVYKKVYVYDAKLGNHAPTVVSSKDQSANFIPPRLRMVLSEKQYNGIITR